MIDFVSGDFFDYDADIRVNTVNCVGVMGAGVALAFKTKYPNMFLQYKKDCENGDLRIGLPTVWHEGDMFAKQLEIINFPTKDHWRANSKYEYIEEGLQWLAQYLNSKQDKVITLPALGCGHGGLDWSIVKEMIVKYLSSSPNKILVFEPQSSRAIKKHGDKLTVAQINKLSNNNIITISNNDLGYPEYLKLYTEKNLYIHGEKLSNNDRFDVTFIVSSELTAEESKMFNYLVEYNLSKKKSLLFGSSVVEKKQIQKSLMQKNSTGICYPSGILKEVQKIDFQQNENLTSLSIGDPFGSFNRSDFLPAVFSRIFLSEIVIFVTPRLDWLQKNMKILKQAQSNFYYVSKNLSESNLKNLKELNAQSYEDLINN